MSAVWSESSPSGGERREGAAVKASHPGLRCSAQSWQRL